MKLVGVAALPSRRMNLQKSQPMLLMEWGKSFSFNRLLLITGFFLSSPHHYSVG